MAGILPGKLMTTTVNGTALRCQVDATLTISVNVTENESCKPSAEDAYLANAWVTQSIDNKSWEITVSAKAYADAIEMSNSDIGELLTTGSPIVQVTFMTTQTTDYDYDEVFVYSGEAIITNYTLNGPQTGDGTYDLTFTGNGPLTLTRTPVTT